jgi:hypothetical protein
MKLLAGWMMVLGFATNAPAAPTTMPHADEELTALVKKAADEALAKFKSTALKPEELKITLIDLRNPEHPKSGSIRGDAGTYPASVIKLFYLVAAHRWLEVGKIKDSPELQKTLRDMIVDSSNEATGKIVDILSGTTGGDELPEDEMKTYSAQRSEVNEYFKSLGFTGINVGQKTYAGASPMGREKAFLGKNFENRNKLTTDATARLLAEIVTGKAVTKERSEAMMKLLSRDMSAKSKSGDDQAHGFTAMVLDPKDKLWSKAGWTTKDRHDAAYVETSDELKFVLVIFTTNHGNERKIIPTVAKIVLEGLRAAK